MAENAINKADADIAVSVSGVAGPGGGSAENRSALYGSDTAAGRRPGSLRCF